MDNTSEIRSMTCDEKRVLACLQEAGEETIFTLINTLFSDKGDIREILRCTSALTSLAMSDFLYLSTERHHETFFPIVNSLNRTLSLIEEFTASSYSWVNSDSIWMPNSRSREYAVVLTQKGVKASDSILRKYGYDILSDEWRDAYF